MQITKYEPIHKEAIKTLNYEWLQKYFSIEPIDEKVLSNPEEEIIKKGGQVLYAWHNDEIVGTVSLMRMDDEACELTKMAVTASAQGLGIGSKLMDAALNEAKALGYKKVILYTSTKLGPALNLYKKYGFAEIPKGETEYQRCDIVFEKIL